MDGYSLWEQILMACFGGDAARLRSLLAHPDCTPALLASPDPITALHAAAVGGSAEVIHMLKEGGAPVKEPTEPVSVMGLGFPPRFKGQPMTKDQRRVLYTTYSCYEAAARLGHEDAFAALIDVGLEPFDWRFLARVHCNEKFQDPLSLLRRLIASFHHVRGWEERLCACLHSAAAEGFGRFDSEQRRQADMSRQLLHFLGQLAAAGHFQLPANQHSVQSALSGAAKLGQLHELQLLASQVPDGLATPELARDIMLGALSSGLLCVVRQAAAASAAPAEPPSSPLDRLLGPHFASLVPGMMEEMVRTAKEHQRPQLVQLLLASGFPITHGVVLLCVSSLDAPTLEAALSRGRPAQPPGQPPRRAFSMPSARTARQYASCPVLTLLETHVEWHKEGWTPEDTLEQTLRESAQYLPVLELLLAAGYRPTVYENVPVSYGSGPPVLAPRFDPIKEDPALDLDGCNQYLWLAIDCPAWSPGQHRRFPPTFRAATQTLLLAVHRWSSTAAAAAGEGSAPAARLGALPDVLKQVFAAAASPLSGVIPEEPAEYLCEVW